MFYRLFQKDKSEKYSDVLILTRVLYRTSKNLSIQVLIWLINFQLLNFLQKYYCKCLLVKTLAKS